MLQWRTVQIVELSAEAAAINLQLLESKQLTV